MLLVLLVLQSFGTRAAAGADVSNARSERPLLLVLLSSATLSSIQRLADSMSGACGVRLLLLLLTGSRSRSGRPCGLVAGRHRRREGSLANANAVDWTTGVSLLLLLRRALACGNGDEEGGDCGDLGCT